MNLSARELRQRFNRQINRVRFLALRRKPVSDSWCSQLTCTGRSDGGGAQWLSIFSVIAFSRYLGVPFVHTPLQVVEHSPANPRSWVDAWNHLFDLKACGIVVARISAQPLPSDDLFLAHRHLCSRSVESNLHSLRHAHQFSNLFPSNLASLRPLIREAYRPPSSVVTPPVPLNRTLVVHVRRGDVTVDGPFRQRFIGAEAVRATCSAIQERYPHLSHILLLSNSPDADLLDLRDQGFLIDTENDVFTHFHWMREAAALVIARSALSYLAAMLNPSLVFAEPFEHPTLPGWIRLKSLR